ncbi:MAG: VCBS repeat-containing protein [Planctomycetaceae bacterium]|nr:VCBS repeat-containing protein [Planctomycetaceae bacterium]
MQRSLALAERLRFVQLGFGPGRRRRNAGVEGALAAFRELAATFAGGELSQAKFKVISVEERGASIVARAYLHARGAPQRGTVQLQSTWSMEWTPVPAEPADALPRLVKLELEHHEELARPGSGATLFAEATDAVFGADKAFREQLRPDLEHWAARIDHSLGLSLIGHEGFALGDVDGDGLDDLYLAQPGGLPNRLFLHQADGTVRDIAQAAGVDFLDPCRSALFADFDGDGDQDLAVELDPYVLLLANDGRGHFTPRARASAPSTTSLTAADFDGDGDLDLYCCGYILPDSANVTPLPYHDANNGRPNTLLRNDGVGADGGWTFVDATREVGLDENNRRFSFAASWEDFDNDGDLDLYVANDFGRNNLYRNDGGKFRDVAAEAGVEDLAAGMGVSWGDYDLDGDFDLYVSNMFSSAGERVAYQRKFLSGADPAVRSGFQRHARGNSLFRNLGDGTFEDVSEACGVTMGRWAWGSIFADLDEDGWPDLVVPNGFVTGSDPADL